MYLLLFGVFNCVFLKCSCSSFRFSRHLHWFEPNSGHLMTRIFGPIHLKLTSNINLKLSNWRNVLNLKWELIQFRSHFHFQFYSIGQIFESKQMMMMVVMLVIFNFYFHPSIHPNINHFYPINWNFFHLLFSFTNNSG